MKAIPPKAFPYFLFFGLLTIQFFSLWGVKEPIAFPDTAGYLESAKSFLNFQWPDTSTRMPGYGFFLFLGSLFFGSFQGVVYIQAFLSSVAGMAHYAILRHFFSQKNSALITLFIFCDYLILNWNGILLTESLSISILAISLFFKISLFSRSHKSFIFLSMINIFLDVLLIFIKPTFFFLPLGYYFYILFQKFRSPYGPSFQRSGALGIFSFLFIAAWIGQHYLKTGRIGLSNITAYARAGQIINANLVSPSLCSPQPCSEKTQAMIHSHRKLNFTASPFEVAIDAAQANPQWSQLELLASFNQDLGSANRFALFLKSVRNLSSIMSSRSYYQEKSWIYNLPLLPYYFEGVRRVSKLLGLPLLLMALFVLFRHKIYNLQDATYLTMGYSIVYVTFVSGFGTFIEWGRMVAPALPALHTFFIISVYKYFQNRRQLKL